MNSQLHLSRHQCQRLERARTGRQLKCSSCLPDGVSIINKISCKVSFPTRTHTGRKTTPNSPPLRSDKKERKEEGNVPHLHLHSLLLYIHTLIEIGLGGAVTRKLWWQCEEGDFATIPILQDDLSSRLDVWDTTLVRRTKEANKWIQEQCRTRAWKKKTHS